MRVNRLNYKVYGKLIDKNIELNEGLNILYGENEAGKSTIFNSLYTLFYGFETTNRDKHPYTNWTKNEIHFSSEIQVKNELFDVERRLMSVPKASIVNKETNFVQTLRNEALPFISNISDSLYKSVFHLSSESLNQMEKQSWESIQEKLIFNYGTEYLQKTSDVLAKLEQDINSLWRKDKRGNPKINQLQSDISALKLEKIQIEQSYEQIKEKSERLEQSRQRLRQIQEEKSNQTLQMKHINKYLPMVERQNRLKMLENSLVQPNVFRSMPTHIDTQYKELSRQIEDLSQKIASIDEQLKSVRGDLYRYSDYDHKLIAFKQDSESLVIMLGELKQLDQEEHAKAEEHIKYSDKAENQYVQLFEIPFAKEQADAIKKISVIEVMSSVQKLIETHDKNELTRAQESENRKKNNAYHYILMAFGVLLMGLGIAIEPIRVVALLGMGLLGFSLAKVDFKGRNKTFDFADETQYRTRIQELSFGIQYPEYVYHDTSFRFFNKLEQLITSLYEAEQAYEKWSQAKDRIQSLENDIEQILTHYQLDTSRGGRISAQFALAQLSHLAETEVDEQKKQLKIEQLISTQNEYLNEKSIRLEALKQIEETLSLLGCHQVDDALALFEKNKQTDQKIRLLLEEVEMSSLENIRVDEITEDALEICEKTLLELQSEEKQLNELVQTIQMEIFKYNELRTIDEIDSELLNMEEQLNLWIEERNKWMIVYEIIKHSDEAYRLLNQPDLITHVSQYMKRMTDGKYSEVLISEENGFFELQFLVEGEIMPISKAFSKGTIQQLFFAFRMAVIDSLDPEGVLPFVLDETFVHWDNSRLVRTIELLKEISFKRQILCFTCHKSLAEKMAQTADIQMIEVAV